MSIYPPSTIFRFAVHTLHITPQTPYPTMIKTVSPKCLNCPTFRAGKCAGTAKRLVATDTSPITRKDKKEGDISSVFTSFSGRKSAPLPERFRDLKRNLTTGFEDQIQKSWDELVEVLKVRTEEVATKRENVRSLQVPCLSLVTY